MVKPGGTGRPRLAISARPAPLPPRGLRMSGRPSALPLPKPKPHFDLAGALAEGSLGGAFAGAAGLRGAALPAGRLLIDLIRRDVDLTMEFTDSVEVLNIRSASERILRGFPEDRRAGPARSDAARSSPDHDLQQENRRSYGHGGWHQRKSCGRVYSDLIGTL